jgi:pimeloyl-ACP methyl ester carboxylesterase
MTIHHALYQGHVSSLSRRHVVLGGMRGNSPLEVRIGDNVGDGSVVMTPGQGVRFRCATEDGEMLAGLHYRGPDGGPGWVVAHGFTHGIDDAVAAVSAPSRGYIRETTPMRRMHWLLDSPAGPAVGRLLGDRLTPPWEHPPPSPVESMADIAVPCLLVHGTKDDYFGPAHAVALRRASGDAADLWIEHDMGHGETGTSAALIDRIAAWATTRMAPPWIDRGIAVHRAATGEAEPGQSR